MKIELYCTQYKCNEYTLLFFQIDNIIEKGSGFTIIGILTYFKF